MNPVLGILNPVNIGTLTRLKVVNPVHGHVIVYKPRDSRTQ